MNNAKLQLEVASPTSIKCGHIEWFALDTKLVGKLKVLLEENKKLKYLCDEYEKEHNNEFQYWKRDRKELLVKRGIIDKAIEELELWQPEIEALKIERDYLLDILRGEDNEKQN